MNRKNYLIAAIALVVVIAGVFFVTQRTSPTGNSVRIALNIPLTGPVASFSGEYANGLTMGIDDACKELGISRDLFRVDAQDNQGQPPQAATLAQKQVLSGFDVYISGVSQMSKAAAPIVDDVAATHFLVSYDAHLVEERTNRMRILAHCKIQGPVYAQYAKMRQAKRVFTFVLNNPELQQEYTEYVEPALRAAGIEPHREIYEFSHSDFRTLALKAKAVRPDLIFVSGFSLHVSPIVRALQAESMVSDGNVLCIMDFNELLGDQDANKTFAGVAYIAPPFEFPENRPQRDEWSARFKARFGKTPNFVPAYAYDTGRLIVLAQAKSGKVNKQTIREQLPYSGISGSITVDDSGDLATPLGVVQVLEDGSLKRIK